MKPFIALIVCLAVFGLIPSSYAETCDLGGLTFEVPNSFTDFQEQDGSLIYCDLNRSAAIVSFVQEGNGISFDAVLEPLLTNPNASITNIETSYTFNGVPYVIFDLEEANVNLREKAALFIGQGKAFFIIYAREDAFDSYDLSVFNDVLYHVQIESDSISQGPSTVDTPVDTSAAYHTLCKGDKNDAVKKMQKRLIKLGYLDSASIDGSYGESEERAVYQFQAENELPQTGIADEETLRALYASTAKRARSYPSLKKGDKGNEVQQLQQRLIELHYLDGKADGDFGNKTKGAVERFQSSVGLPITGVADSNTQKALFSDNAPKAKEYKKLDYKALSRNPDSYMDGYYSFSGEVVQVMEESQDDGTVFVYLRVATKSWHDDIVMIYYTRQSGESRILEDDKVTVYAQYKGLYTYEAIWGNEVTLPLFLGEQVSLR